MTDKCICHSGEVRELRKALADLTDAFLSRHGCFPLDQTNDQERHWHRAMTRAYELIPHEGEAHG